MTLTLLLKVVCSSNDVKIYCQSTNGTKYCTLHVLTEIWYIKLSLIFFLSFRLVFMLNLPCKIKKGHLCSYPKCNCDFALYYSQFSVFLPLVNSQNRGKYAKIKGKIAMTCEKNTSKITKLKKIRAKPQWRFKAG